MCFNFIISTAARCSEVWGWGQDSFPAEKKKRVVSLEILPFPYTVPFPKTSFTHNFGIAALFRDLTSSQSYSMQRLVFT